MKKLTQNAWNDRVSFISDTGTNCGTIYVGGKEVGRWLPNPEMKFNPFNATLPLYQVWALQADSHTMEYAGLAKDKADLLSVVIKSSLFKGVSDDAGN
tara:strand:- start:453 stop:746 length:294 start_codon:yes stop_codon:yes gene_type:complete